MVVRDVAAAAAAATAADGGGVAAPLPPRHEALGVLRSPTWAGGGEPRTMVSMTQDCCRFGSSQDRFVEFPH